jgi:HEAT repeats
VYVEEPSSEELQQWLRDLHAGRVPQDQLHHVIHELGRARAVGARPVVERFLQSEDADLPWVALEVLTRHFRLQDHLPTARQVLLQDKDEHCRMGGADALGSLLKNTGDVDALRLLAGVVRNDEENAFVRLAAYAAMFAIIQYDGRQQLEFSRPRSFREIDRLVDWNLVDAYLRLHKDTGRG